MTQVEPERASRLTLYLSGLVVALAAAGPTVSIGQALCSPSQIAAAVLLLHLACSRLVGRTRTPQRGTTALILSSSLMGVGVLSAPLMWPAAAAFANFISGTVTATLIGVHAQSLDRSRVTPLDVGFVVFIGWTSIQHFGGLAPVASAAELHATLLVAWGGSNYIGAVLVVAGYWLVARTAEVRTGRWLLFLGACVAMVTAISTLSRGAVITLAAGLLVIAWRAGTTRTSRFVWRISALAVPFVGLSLLTAVVDERFSGTSADPATNINARIDLYRLAFADFLHSPFIGTGWTGLRANSEMLFGSPISFAHNWYLSAVQIGGLLALPVLAAFTYLAFRAIRMGRLFGAAVLAAFSASMIEPVIEGYVGSLILIFVVVAANELPTDPRARSAGRAIPNHRQQHWTHAAHPYLR